MKRSLIVFPALIVIASVAATIRDSRPSSTPTTGSVSQSVMIPGTIAIAPHTPATQRDRTTPAAASWPPPNPALAPSSWPIFHANNDAQASTPLRGPEPGDRFDVQFIRTPEGHVSSWTLLSPPDTHGAQAAWGSSTTHVFKAVLDGPTFRMVDSIALPRRRFAFDLNIAMLRDGTIVTTNKARREFVLIANEHPGDAYSPIRVIKTLPVPAEAGDLSAQFSIAHDGKIIFLSNDDVLGALDPNNGRSVLFPLNSPSGDLGVHNAFAIDARGGIYLVSERAMTRVDWDGRGFRLGWRVAYDFKGPGCPESTPGKIRQVIAVARGQPCTGSGTTPTLLGTRDDGLVIVVDGHRPRNRAVAFWRDAPPADWPGLPGQDRRIAAILPLPYSTPDGEGFTMENSPTAFGWEMAGAQWNGFKPGCNPMRGVQKWRWDPAARRMSLAWTNNHINMNGVLTYAAGSGLIYQTGRRDCVYRLYGLDWRTGQVALDIALGEDERYLDQGNQIVPTADRSLLFGSARGLVRIRPY
jgi:hypothetical protein